VGRVRKGWGTHKQASTVAWQATVLGALLYLLACFVLDLVVFEGNIHQIDVVLTSRLQTLEHSAAVATPSRPAVKLSEPTTLPSSSGNEEFGGLPVMVWFVPAHGAPISEEPGTPALPRTLANLRGPLSARVGTLELRLFGGPGAPSGSWVVVGASTADATHDLGTLLLAEGALGPFVFAMLFFVTLVIGRRAVGPVEALRMAQLDFTADASHELRTPLSVIEAEVGLALSAPREAEALTSALRNVSTETARLRRIVDDLLWLARFEQHPAPPPDEPVELRSILDACSRRFEPIARSKGVALVVSGDGADVTINAPAEWLDRLVTVLVDNACRYAGEGGQVELSVSGSSGSAVLTVDDSGPGIPEAERERVLERFHRSSSKPGGAGLGLAIADAVVSATSGRWLIGTAPLGGARVQVTWHTR
jgi:signal transduction histidine kinase